MLAEETRNTAARPRLSHYSLPPFFESKAKGASTVSVRAEALRRRPWPPSSSVLLTLSSVPGAPRLKSLDRGCSRVRWQHGEVIPTPETSSRRPGFAQLLPPLPRSFVRVHLIACQGWSCWTNFLSHADPEAHPTL